MVASHEKNVRKSLRKMPKGLDESLFIVTDVSGHDQGVTAEFLFCQAFNPLEVLRVVGVDVRDGEDLHGGGMIRSVEGFALVVGVVVVGVGDRGRG